MVQMTATDASRNFSDLLGRVSAGESVEIIRNGAPVARVVPPAQRLLSAAAFRRLYAAAPPVDEAFGDAVASLRSAIGPPDSAWPS